MFGNVLYSLDKINDANIVPVLMPIEDEKKWEKEMMVKFAINQGIEERERTVISNMLKEKLDMKLISKITGLSVKKIKEIAKKTN